jgi:hypothetical protein
MEPPNKHPPVIAARMASLFKIRIELLSSSRCRRSGFVFWVLFRRIGVYPNLF